LRFYLLLIPCYLLATTGIDSDLEDDNGPWFTGPLLTDPAYTIQKGHFNIQPYLFFINQSDDSFSQKAINNAYVFVLGLTEFIDINIIPQFTANYGTTGKNSIGMGDLIIGSSLQLLREDKRFGDLTLKIGLDQVFPSGRYQNLDPIFSGNDGFGNGCWSTALYCVGSKLFQIGRKHYLSLSAELFSVLSIPCPVKGISVYGGDLTTDGKIANGAAVILDFAFELNITKNIALAMDIENLWTMGSFFKGTTYLDVGNPEKSYSLSLAPALEYSWSKNVGIIAGVWFTAIALNTEPFVNLTIALNIYI
jgi:hypothetical protein